MAKGGRSKDSVTTSFKIVMVKRSGSIHVAVGLGRDTELDDFDLAAFHRWLVSNGYKVNYQKQVGFAPNPS